MKTKLRSTFAPSIMAVAVGLTVQHAQAEQKTAEAIMQETCVACHVQQEDGKYSRISHQRKTPEGWLMSIARMQVVHGLEISNEDRRTVVKYLADKQGLAPDEAKDSRYAIERRLNTIENYHKEELGEMCARCHSGARFALQRRPASEWEHLVNFHLGQWHSLEYQSLSRDRDWFDIATTKTVKEIAERFPYDSKEWAEWQKNKPAAETLKGSWSFSGHFTGKGELNGLMSVEPTENDNFKLTVTGQYADGSPFKGEGSAILYNGYEWRGHVTIDGIVMRQVFAVQNGVMEGRMFERERDERGLDFIAAQQNTKKILSVQPAYVKAGEESVITIVGSGLKGVPTFGKGVEVVKVEESSPEQMKVRVKVAADAELGLHKVKVADLEGAELAVYKQVHSLKVVPDYSIARVGGNGGAMEKVEGRFDAEAWAVGADGKTPYRIGVMPATWSVEPFDQKAIDAEDIKFAGKMDNGTGVFTPGDAGPNPERKMMASNVGNLKVIAEVEDGQQKVKGEGHMVVTVQRWNTPPIP